jgi:hypothetical protein
MAPINDRYQGDPPWANGTVLQDYMPYYYGRGWHEIKVTCWDSWVDGTGYLDFTFPRNRVQSIQQPLISLFSQQINQLLQNSIASSYFERFPLLERLLELIRYT